MTPRIHSAQILLVGDEPTTARTRAFLFSQRGFVMEHASSAREALALWDRDAFDLVVIDEQAPALGAIDLCRQLRAVAVNPILLLPLQSDEALVLRAYEAGAEECVVKPIRRRIVPECLLQAEMSV